MAILIHNDTKIPVSEVVADAIRDRMSQGEGGWLTGSLLREKSSGAQRVSAEDGTQLRWIHPAHSIVITLGLGLNSEADRAAMEDVAFI